MFVITVSFGTTACPLLFKTEESAKAAWDKILTRPGYGQQGYESGSLEQMRQAPTLTPISPIYVADDFGRTVFTGSDKLCGAIFEDLEISKEGQIEQALHQARTQAKAQQRGQADPALSAMSRMNGPSVISPFNGRM